MRTALLALVLLVPSSAHAQQCLHGPNQTPDQAKREKAALGVVRAINTAQNDARNKTGKFVASQADLAADPDMTLFLKSLGATLDKPEVIPGFELRMIVDGERYVLTLKDTTDPCRFAFVSDDGAVILRGEAIK